MIFRSAFTRFEAAPEGGRKENESTENERTDNEIMFSGGPLPQRRFCKSISG